MTLREVVVGLGSGRHFLWGARRGATENLPEGWHSGQCNDGDGESEANCLHKLSRILKYPMQEERGQKRKRRRFRRTWVHKPEMRKRGERVGKKKACLSTVFLQLSKYVQA